MFDQISCVGAASMDYPLPWQGTHIWVSGPYAGRRDSLVGSFENVTVVVSRVQSHG